MSNKQFTLCRVCVGRVESRYIVSTPHTWSSEKEFEYNITEVLSREISYWFLKWLAHWLKLTSPASCRLSVISQTVQQSACSLNTGTVRVKNQTLKDDLGFRWYTVCTLWLNLPERISKIHRYFKQLKHPGQ